MTGKNRVGPVKILEISLLNKKHKFGSVKGLLYSANCEVSGP